MRRRPTRITRGGPERVDAGAADHRRPAITFVGPDGKQYVAIACGVGGWAGAVVSVDLDPRDESAALGFAAAMTDLELTTPKGGAVFVFGL